MFLFLKAKIDNSTIRKARLIDILVIDVIKNTLKSVSLCTKQERQMGYRSDI